tara:strand:+ start:661 stop:783 length:123 start_codon:yes stop_codon:yes gene_type:complete
MTKRKKRKEEEGRGRHGRRDERSKGEEGRGRTDYVKQSWK